MKRVVSGIQPSGQLTIGNYIGAIQKFITLQHNHDCFFMIVDMHAVTIPQHPEKLREQTESVVALYIAAGIDPEKSTIFLQSHVHQHAELGWLMMTLTMMGELERMTQFKDKSAHQKSIGAGLFAYPSLMAADILLYQADFVPVGADQKQHLELTRHLAMRFNQRYGELFTVPEPYIPKLGARIMSLDDATKKMSKSNSNLGSYITLLDNPDMIRKKINRAKTDSEAIVKYDPVNKLEISNLMVIYSHITNKSLTEIENKYYGHMYGTFKKDLADHIVTRLKPLQARYKQVRRSGEHSEVLQKGAIRAREVAEQTIVEVKRRMGFL